METQFRGVILEESTGYFHCFIRHREDDSDDRKDKKKDKKKDDETISPVRYRTKYIATFTNVSFHLNTLLMGISLKIYTPS